MQSVANQATERESPQNPKPLSPLVNPQSPFAHLRRPKYCSASPESPKRAAPAEGPAERLPGRALGDWKGPGRAARAGSKVAAYLDVFANHFHPVTITDESSSETLTAIERSVCLLCIRRRRIPILILARRVLRIATRTYQRHQHVAL